MILQRLLPIAIRRGGLKQTWPAFRFRRARP